MNRIAVNTRALAEPVTGIQRYIIEILERMGSAVDCLAPRGQAGNALGLLWDQFLLPRRLQGRLLWSPSSTGPLMVERQVVTVHDVIVLDHPEWFHPASAALSRVILPRLVRRARRVIAVSEYTRQRLVALTRIPPEKVVVIPEGVDSRFNPRPAEEVSRMRQLLNLPGGPYVLSLGTLEPRKNLPRLLKAWAAACSRLPDNMWLVLAGEPGSRKIFRKINLGAIPPRVHWTGRVEDDLLPALYSGATAFLYVSLYEGFGLPLLEAMACGAPVATSNVSSLPEVVEDAAFAVPPTDTEAISDVIVKIATNQQWADALRQKGLIQAGRFSWDIAATGVLKILQSEADI